MHPMGALFLGAAAGWMFVVMFTLTQNRWKIDDVLGVWPLHGLCGALGGVAAGFLGLPQLGGLGKIAIGSQLIGTGLAIVIALTGGFLIYGILKLVVGLRLDPEQEFEGADLTIHQISASSDKDTGW
jgi:Amt family ammonium transporter